MESRIAAALLCIVFGVVVRYGSLLDLITLSLLVFLRKQAFILNFISEHFASETSVKLLTVGLISFTILQVARFFSGLRQTSNSNEDFLAKPMFFPCRTNHTRLVPTKHSFSYSYLLAGIPVGWKGSVGGMLSADSEEKKLSWYERLFSLKHSSAWFSINGDDYFERGHVPGGVREKLHNYLKTQNVDPSEFEYAYLFTAARFLGYASNPVSIWNLYSSTRELTAAILEVNNTFDERHSYFLRPAHHQAKDARGPRFSGSWPKDFYVSVFNARDGAYSLSTSDALYPAMSGAGSIETTISLSSADGSPKLIARLFSTGPGLDPSAMSMIQKSVFLAKWWWVGFATFFPRTVYQAMFILLKKKLPWSFRPEPRKNTLPRHADENEAFIEKIFRDYLKSLVESSSAPISLSYTAAGTQNTTPELISSASAQLVSKDAIHHLDVKVLTPLFYSRFVHYTSFQQAMELESSNATISLSNTHLLALLTTAEKDTHISPNPPTNHREPLSFKLLRGLRTPALSISNCETSPLTTTTTTTTTERPSLTSPVEKEMRRTSDFETYLLNPHTSPQQRAEYARRVGKMYLADRIALGWPEILALEVWVVKVVLWWMLVVRVLL